MENLQRLLVLFHVAVKKDSKKNFHDFPSFVF